jgi:hypothetical protein
MKEKIWSDNDYKEFSKWMKSVLKEGTCIVEFTKKDGSLRNMKCTLNPDKLPKTELVEGKKERVVTNKDNISVYDIEADGWRCFNVRSVKTFTFTLGE